MPKTFTEFLREQFLSRQNRNASYSLRAFASFLGVEPSFLSKVLMGKRNPSSKMIAKLAERLGQSPNLIDEWASVSASIAKKDGFYLMSEAEWDGVSGWEHFAILSLIRTSDFKSNIDWISKRLGITKEKTTHALERLIQNNFIRLKNQKISLAVGPVRTTHDVSSETLKQSHRENLLQAIDCLSTVPIDFRDITSISIAIDPEKLPQAKEKIKKFRRSMGRFLEIGNRKEVYNLNIQLVPVTQLSKKTMRKSE